MASAVPTHTHSHPNGDGFSAATHGHTHEILSGPGSYTAREMPLTEGRDWKERAFTVGIGGYVSPSFSFLHWKECSEEEEAKSSLSLDRYQKASADVGFTGGWVTGRSGQARRR